jgi:hypothetical protein
MRKLKGFWDVKILKALRVLNLVVVLANISLMFFGVYVINNDASDSRSLGLVYVWLGLSVAVFALCMGPLPVAGAQYVNHKYFQSCFHEEWENLLCCGQKRRATLAVYIVCMGLCVLGNSIALGILKMDRNTLIDDQESHALGLVSSNGGLFVAISTIVIEFGAFVSAFVYRKSLTKRYMIDNHNVLYEDQAIGRDAGNAWEIKPEELTFGKKIGLVFGVVVM